MKFKFSGDKSRLILTEATNREIHQLKIWLNRQVKDYFFKKKKNKNPHWTGVTDHFLNGYIRVGLWEELFKCCKEHGFKFDVPKNEFPFDENIKIEDVQKFCDEFYKGYKAADGLPFTPYEHQIEPIFKFLKYKFGLIEVATAGGKSLIISTAIFYYLKNINPKGKILIIVPNISLVTQMYDNIYDYNRGYNKENKNPLDLRLVEFMSDKPRKIREGDEPNICLGTYQSLEKYPELWFRQFDMVFTDEAHTATAVTLERVLIATLGTSKYRLGVSGTFPNNDTAEYLTICSLHGPKIYTIGSKSLIEKNIISDVKIKALILNHNDESFANNVSNIKRSGDGQKAYQLEKEYVQKSLLRKEFITKLTTKFQQNSLLLFHTIEYGTSIYDHLRDNVQGKDFFYIDGTTSAEKRKFILSAMEDTTGNPKILVASYGTLSTGINVKAISNIVFMDSFKSYRIVLQSIGRGLRLHKEKVKLHVFDLVDIIHKTYKNTLFKHYEVRKNDIYKKQDFPFDELKITL